MQNYAWAKELWKSIQDYQALGVKIRDDWDDVKDDVMRLIVFEKFSQNDNLRKILLETGNKRLFEHTHRDAYWGDGHPIKDPSVHGNGKNMLGIILEETREKLRGGRITNQTKVGSPIKVPPPKVQPNYTTSLVEDRRKCMIMGALLGNALGAAWQYIPKAKYSGRLKKYHINSVEGHPVMSPGQLTDAEMALVAMTQIQEDDGEYIQDHVLPMYFKWANSVHLLGANVSSRFKRVKTIKGYQNRLNKDLQKGDGEFENDASLTRVMGVLSGLPSNMSLDQIKEIVESDARLTNPSEVAVESTLYFVKLLHALTHDKSSPSYSDVESYEVFYALYYASFGDIDGYLAYTKQESLNIPFTYGYLHSRDWCLNVLYIAISALTSFPTLDEAMENVLRNPSFGGVGANSARLGCVVGALFGATLGEKGLMKSEEMSENWTTIMNFDGKVNEGVETSEIRPDELLPWTIFNTPK